MGVSGRSTRCSDRSSDLRRRAVEQSLADQSLACIDRAASASLPMGRSMWPIPAAVGSYTCRPMARSWTRLGQDVRRPGAHPTADRCCCGSNGDLYVVNGEEGAVLHLSSDGSYINHWQALATDTERGPHLAIGADGAIWVSEPDGRRVSRFASDGTPAGIVSETRQGKRAARANGPRSRARRHTLRWRHLAAGGYGDRHVVAVALGANRLFGCARDGTLAAMRRLDDASRKLGRR